MGRRALLHLYQPRLCEKEIKAALPVNFLGAFLPISVSRSRPCLCGTLALPSSFSSPLSLSPSRSPASLPPLPPEAGGNRSVNRRMAPGAPGADTRFEAVIDSFQLIIHGLHMRFNAGARGGRQAGAACAELRAAERSGSRPDSGAWRPAVIALL